MNEKKIVEMEETNGEVIVETKPKFGDKVKSFFSRNKKKFIIAGLGAAGIAAGVLVKNHKDKLRAEEEADEAERNALAEDWFSRGLEAGRSSIPETIEEPVEVMNEEESY